MVLWFKIFLSLSNITHLLPMDIRISSMILKFLQVFRKLAVFPLLLTKFSILLKSMCLLHAIFVRFIFNQKEKCGFIWSERFSCFLLNLPIFIQKKRAITFNFRKIFVKQTQTWTFSQVFFCIFYTFQEHLFKGIPLSGWFHYFNREALQKCENTTLQNNLRGVLISWRKYLFNSK